jgi:hypothetical protein
MPEVDNARALEIPRVSQCVALNVYQSTFFHRPHFMPRKKSGTTSGSVVCGVIYFVGGNPWPDNSTRIRKFRRNKNSCLLPISL